MNIEYLFSSTKWFQLSYIAFELLHNERLSVACRKLAEHITLVGDAMLTHTATASIENIEDFYEVVVGRDGAPCPHCIKYRKCSNCPLTDHRGCCRQWYKVIIILHEYERIVSSIDDYHKQTVSNDGYEGEYPLTN